MIRTVFKLAIVLILIGIIAGISTIKSNLAAKRESVNIESIKDEYFRTRDSILLKKFDDSTRVYIDSIETLEKFYRYQIDSLNRYYAQKESLLTARYASQKRNTRTKKSGKINSADSASALLLHEYNALLKKLPTDLTGYEKKVSVNELTVELSKKYKISPDSVRSIISAKS